VLQLGGGEVHGGTEGCVFAGDDASDAQGKLVHSGIFVGDDLETYLMAAGLSAKQNITLFDQPIKKSLR